MASQITIQGADKKTPKLRTISLCAGNSPLNAKLFHHSPQQIDRQWYCNTWQCYCISSLHIYFQYSSYSHCVWHFVTIFIRYNACRMRLYIYIYIYICMHALYIMVTRCNVQCKKEYWNTKVVISAWYYDISLHGDQRTTYFDGKSTYLTVICHGATVPWSICSAYSKSHYPDASDTIPVTPIFYLCND